MLWCPPRQETGEEHHDDDDDDHDNGHGHAHDHDHEDGKHDHSHDHKHSHHGALSASGATAARPFRFRSCLARRNYLAPSLLLATNGTKIAQLSVASFLYRAAHKHDDRVTSCGFEIEGEMDMQKLNGWLSKLLQVRPRSSQARDI